MNDDECFRALRIVARLHDGVDNLVEDRKVPMTRPKAKKQKTCWHCGSVDHVAVVECPSRGSATGRLLEETMKGPKLQLSMKGCLRRRSMILAL